MEWKGTGEMVQLERCSLWKREDRTHLKAERAWQPTGNLSTEAGDKFPEQGG